MYRLIYLVMLSFMIANDVDVLNLKNGDIIKGNIIEHKIHQYIRIELKGGSIMTFNYDQIESIEIEQVSTRTASNYQSPRQTTSTRSRTTKTGPKFIGGFAMSKIAGNLADDYEDAGTDLSNVTGFRFGIENRRSNGFTTGVTFTQRGLKGETGGGNEIESGEFNYNYLTGYALTSINLSSNQERILSQN